MRRKGVGLRILVGVGYLLVTVFVVVVVAFPDNPWASLRQAPDPAGSAASSGNALLVVEPTETDWSTSTWNRSGFRMLPWRWQDGRVPPSPTITPLLVAELLVEGERWPVYVHVIDHPDARVLVDTGMTELRPEIADIDPRLVPLSEQAFDLAGVDIVVNTHLHFDHCGGNHLFAGRPIYVQRQELEDARTEDDYTIREWVDAPGVRYEPVDGELELLPGLRLVPAPGHTRGLQVVVVETGGRPVVVGGDVAVRFGELDEPRTEGQLRVRALEPELVWLAHEHEPWRPRTA